MYFNLFNGYNIIISGIYYKHPIHSCALSYLLVVLRKKYQDPISDKIRPIGNIETCSLIRTSSDQRGIGKASYQVEGKRDYIILGL